ncbi:MAG: AAA family ATPase, partial [Verrucomicrobiota bacterium]|nr:AAA family ATPase [Verrucomicrobiota bacterium]
MAKKATKKKTARSSKVEAAEELAATAKKSILKPDGTGEIDDVAAVKKLNEARDSIVAELRKTIVGMDQAIDEVLIAIFSRGHGLLEGVPGLAKTLLVSSIAKTLSLSFKRIQFTPDLMPSDITGSELLQDDPETRERKFMFTKGPIFSNMVLADEINRTPPKTQAALLEAMQEKIVSA